MIKFFQKLKAKKGFTLVELIVVIAIIGVLAAILIPTMLGYVTSSRVQSANSTAAEVKNSVNNWITSLDTRGYSIKRNSTAFTWKITFNDDGTVEVEDLADTQFSKTGIAYQDDLQNRLAADYPDDPAYAEVHIKDGSVYACCYISGAEALATGAPDKDAFSSKTFDWGGSADGVTADGDIVGTSPILIKAIGDNAADES